MGEEKEPPHLHQPPRCVLHRHAHIEAGAVLRLVASAVAIEAGVVAVRLAFAAAGSCLLSLPVAATISLRLLLLAAVRTPAALLGQAG